MPCSSIQLREINALVPSEYDSGGLGLDPSHFATLSKFSSFILAHVLTELVVALMCVAQVVYQFYLYP